MREWKSQSHVKWYCKYHIVFSPKYRKKAMYGSLRKGVGRILRELCKQTGVELVEGHAMSDHVHVCLSIPPKYSVAAPRNEIAHQNPEIESGHVREEALEYIFVSSQMRSSHASRF